MSETTKRVPRTLAVATPARECCPSFDDDCLDFSFREAHRCWNNSDGIYDTTRPGYCPLVQGPLWQPEPLR